MKHKKCLALTGFLLLAIGLYAQVKNSGANTKSGSMNEYILLVRLKENPYTPEELAIVTEKWNRVVDQWKADGIFVTSFVFPSESYVISGSGREAEKGVVLSNNLMVVSSIVLQAGSLEEAVALAKASPVFDYGGTVEVRQVRPRPQPVVKN